MGKDMTKSLDFFAPGMDTVTRSESGAPLKVLRPDKTPLNRKDGVQVEIILYGPDSAKYREASRLQTKLLTDRASVGERADAQKDADQADAARLFLVTMTKDWNVTLTDDSPAPCDATTVERFYVAFPDVAEQADRFIGRRASFMKAS
jgi:hypothetical protein